jgi:hypothetical protein
MSMVAQIGAPDAQTSAPRKLPYDGNVVGWVAQNGQSRTIAPSDELSHPFVEKGRYKSAACLPVGTALRFGVILACREPEDAISQEQVMMLELVSAQLANALAKDARG